MQLSPDIYSEQSLLSQCLKFEESRKKAVYMLSPFDFKVPEHQNLASVIWKLTETEQEIHFDVIITLSTQTRIGKSFDFEFLEGIYNGYSGEKADITVLIGKIKKDKVVFDLLEKKIPDLISKLTDSTVSLEYLEKVFQSYEEKIRAAKIENKLDFQNLSQLTELYNEVDDKRKKGLSFFPTGFSNLDECLTYGFFPKGITVVAGRPGMAKSAFITNMAKNLSNKKIHCALFSLETDNISFYDRLISQYSRLPIEKLVKYRSQLSPGEEKSLAFEKQRLQKNSFLFVNDKPSNLDYIENQISLLQEKIDAHLVVVIDLFMKVTEFLSSDFSAGVYERNLNKIQQIAKKLGVHCVLVAQINRAVEKRKNRRPMLSDLKSSGSWEEVSDLILGLHRESYYLEKYDNEFLDQDILEVQVLKQRQGQDGQVVKFIFEREFTSVAKYQDLDTEEYAKQFEGLI